MNTPADTGSTCTRCGEVHDPARCNAHSKRTGKQCKNRAGKGTDHVGYGNCDDHLGGTANHVEHARRLRVDEEIAETLHRYELEEGADDPLLQLLSALRTAGAMRRIFAELVGTLGGGATRMYVERDDEDGDRVLVQMEPAGLVGPDHKGDGKPHVYVAELRAWTVEAARVAKLALDAGVDERRVRVAERHAEELGEVVRSAVRAVVAAFAAHGAGDAIVRAVSAQLPGLMRESIERSGVIDVTSEET